MGYGVFEQLQNLETVWAPDGLAGWLASNGNVGIGNVI